MGKIMSAGKNRPRSVHKTIAAILAVAIAAVSTAFASRQISYKAVFMCRPEDAVRAGWDVSSLSTNVLGLVQLTGYCHAMVSDDYADEPKPRGIVSAFVLCTCTNIVWNAATQRLECGDVWFTKGE